MRNLSKEEFDSWLSDPTTQVVLAMVQAKIDSIKQQWADGEFTAETEFGTKFLDARALGAVRALQEFLSWDEVTINGVLQSE